MIDIDIKGLPLPADSPEAGACIELERPEAGLVILRLVPPHRSLAVFDLPLMRDFAVTLNALSAEVQPILEIVQDTVRTLVQRAGWLARWRRCHSLRPRPPGREA